MKWKFSETDPVREEEIAGNLHIPKLLSKVLINRGIKDSEEAEKFLSPKLEDIPSPFLMKDMDRAVERIIGGICHGEKIAIYGDYDVDGVTSTAFLISFFKSLDIEPFFYIPHRLMEGYGMNLEAVKMLKEAGMSLILTVDCGISNLHEVSLCSHLGMDVIVLDHHEVHDELPGAYAIINPKQKDCPFPFSGLSGVGVAFNLALALRSRLREKGFFYKRSTPNLKRQLDLVAMGTVSDMVPLVDLTQPIMKWAGLNRTLVKFGLEELNSGKRTGIKALMEVCGLREGEINTESISFRLGPRINAAGRMGKAEPVVQLLLTNDAAEAKRIAQFLDEENSSRQRIEDKIFSEALELIKAEKDILQKRSLVLYREGWHPGVIGIVASRLVKEFSKLVILIALEKGKGKGSARGIEKFNLYQGLKACQEYLQGFGGHRLAAGLSILEKDILEFSKKFEDILQTTLSEEDLVPQLLIDSWVEPEQLTLELVESIDRLSPFGIGNPRPVFAIKDLLIQSTRVVGSNHLRFTAKKNHSVLSGIGFWMEGKILPHSKVDVAFEPQINFWEGLKAIELNLLDLGGNIYSHQSA